MKLTKRQKIYAAIAVIVVIVFANIINRPKPYTGIWGFDGGAEYGVVVQKLQEKDFYLTQKTTNKIVGTNAKGVIAHWSNRDKWKKVECEFTPSGKLKKTTLTKWGKLDYAPSLIKELEKTFGKIQGEDKVYDGNDFFLFGKPFGTHATLNASDNPPFASVSIMYDVRD